MCSLGAEQQIRKVQQIMKSHPFNIYNNTLAPASHWFRALKTQAAGESHRLNGLRDPGPNLIPPAPHLVNNQMQLLRAVLRVDKYSGEPEFCVWILEVGGTRKEPVQHNGRSIDKPCVCVCVCVCVHHNNTILKNVDIVCLGCLIS